MGGADSGGVEGVDSVVGDGRGEVVMIVGGAGLRQLATAPMPCRLSPESTKKGSSVTCGAARLAF